MDTTTTSHDMEQARVAFHELIRGATRAELRRRSSGTRWTNRQLLFHMVFGYLVVRTLLPLVRIFDRLPLACSRTFSAVLHAARGPYDVINYAGSCIGGQLLTPRAVAALLDHTVAALQRQLAGEDDQGLRRRMAFPTSWDPYFSDIMTVHDVYHFGSQHFAHHREQLTLDPARTRPRVHRAEDGDDHRGPA